MAEHKNLNDVKKARFEVGERLTSFRESLVPKLKRKPFAELLGIEYGTQESYESGRSEPGSFYWKKLKEKFPDADVSFIMTGVEGFKNVEVVPLNVMIPVVSEVRAGSLTLGFSDQEIISWLPFFETKEKDVFAVKVSGNSMSPEINEGDYVLCAPEKPFVSGKIYLVVNDDSEQTLKRVIKQKGGYLLVPANPDYEPLFIAESNVIKFVRVIHKIGAVD